MKRNKPRTPIWRQNLPRLAGGAAPVRYLYIQPSGDSISGLTYHHHRERDGHGVTGQVRDRVRPERVPNRLVVTEKAALERPAQREEDQQRYGHCNGGRVTADGATPLERGNGCSARRCCSAGSRRAVMWKLLLHSRIARRTSRNVDGGEQKSEVSATGCARAILKWLKQSGFTLALCTSGIKDPFNKPKAS